MSESTLLLWQLYNSGLCRSGEGEGTEPHSFSPGPLLTLTKEAQELPEE